MDKQTKDFITAVFNCYLNVIKNDSVFKDFINDNDLSDEDMDDFARVLASPPTNILLSNMNIKKEDIQKVLFEKTEEAFKRVNEQFDDTMEVINQIMEERIILWHDEVLDRLNQVADKVKAKVEGKKKTVKVAKKPKKPTKKADAEDEMFYVQFALMMQICEREDDATDLCDKYSEIDKDLIKALLCADVLCGYFNTTAKTAEDKAPKAVQQYKMWAKKAKSILETTAKKIADEADDYNKFHKDYTEVFQDHIMEFIKKLIKKLPAALEALNKR